MPTNTPVPSHVSGDVLTAADWDTLVPVNTMIGLFGAGGTITGSAPAQTAPNFEIQAGSNVSGSTAGTITFPHAFPNGVLAVVATNGDAGTGQGNVQLSPAVTTGVNFTIAQSAAGPWRINWIAIGF
jgi:hypothetical protein